MVFQHTTFTQRTARALACATFCVFVVTGVHAELVSYSGVVAGQEKVAAAESVPSKRGFQYVSLSSLVQQFGGGCRVASDRVQVDMGGNTAWINPNGSQVSGSLDRFSLTHPVLNQDGDVWISTEDVAPFFGQAFRVAVRSNAKTPTQEATPPQSPVPDPNAPDGAYSQSKEEPEALTSLEAVTPVPAVTPAPAPQPTAPPAPEGQPPADPAAITPPTPTDAEALSSLPEVATAPPPQPEPEMLSSIPEQIPPAAPPPEGQQAPASVAPPTAPQQTAEPGQPAQSLVKVAETQQQQKRIARIIVDAGHGGGDPGCEVGSGVNEKDVTLAIALQMKKQIKEVTGAEVLLVRDKDAEVSLRERTNWAQSNKGDLLISVHLGASMTPSAKGVEIFCQPGGAKPHTGTSSTPAGDAYTQQSRGVAEAIGAAFSGAGVVFRGVRETPCRLLKDAPMPGIVIEAGFATNAEESATLATEAVQAQIAKCAADGIMAYLGEEVTRRANASAGQAAPDGGKKP